MEKTEIKSCAVPATLLRLLSILFGTSNRSEAVYKGIIKFLSNSIYRERMDDFALHQLLTIEERRKMEVFSVRMSREMLDGISHYEASTSFNLITVMLANFLFFSRKAAALANPPGGNLLTHFKADESMKLLRLVGSKWANSMQYAIWHILTTSNRIWLTSIDVFAGALGIFSNFRCAFYEIINDIDLKKTNLYRVIQRHPDELLLKIHAHDVGESDFMRYKDIVENTNLKENSPPDVDAAAAFVYTNWLSIRNTGSSFAGSTHDAYTKKTDAIMPLHERLKQTTIHGLHAKDVIRKYQKEHRAILIIDPPYLDKDYYQPYIQTDLAYRGKKGFDFNDHVQLAKMLRTAHENYGTDFIYFCRTTITRAKDRTTKEITNLDDLDSGDRHMQGRIDDFFWGNGFYYIDVPYDQCGTIERIITTFDFEGAKPYGKGVS